MKEYKVIELFNETPASKVENMLNDYAKKGYTLKWVKESFDKDSAYQEYFDYIFEKET